MALGGGTFTSQNKILPGSYMNFVSVSNTSATVSDRGTAALPFEFDYSPDGLYLLTEEDFQKNTVSLFGCNYTDDEMYPLREIFCNAKEVWIYNTGGVGVKASCDYAEALYAGENGNNFKIIISEVVGDDTKLKVQTLYKTSVVDEQTVDVVEGTDGEVDDNGLVSNDYVTFKTTVELSTTTGMSLTGGSREAGTVTEVQKALDAFESVSFNTLICPTTEDSIKDYFAEYTERLRDEVGKKFQTVIYYNDITSKNPYDYEGVIAVPNKCTTDGKPEYAAVFWVGGASAGCKLSKSCTNKAYDGELDFYVEYTQTQLETAIGYGFLILHRVNDEVHVLSDITSLVTTTEEKGEDFKYNQVVRVCDAIGNDIAEVFNTKYCGLIQNTVPGRTSLWKDIVKYCDDLQTQNVVENFVSDDITVERGDTKKSVVVTMNISIAVAMEQLYMTVVVQ